MSALVEVKDMCKVYNPGENEVRALDHVSVTIEEKEFVAIIGHSGSGKSTLMNMLGCLDVPTSGTYLLHDQDVSGMSEDRLYFSGLQSDPESHRPGKCGAAAHLQRRGKAGADRAFQKGPRQGGTGKADDA